MAKIPGRIHPAVWLVYLLFYVYWPLVAGNRAELVKTAAVSVLFLPLYFWTASRQGWRTLPVLAAIAGLGIYGCTSNVGAAVFFIYSAALAVRLGSNRRAVGWLGVLLLLEGATAAYLAAHAFAGALYSFGPVFVCTLLIGLVCIHQETIEKKNAELRQSREQITRLAEIAERERIGRDLHDLLGHSLSLVVLKSQLAGRLLARGDQRAGPEVAEIERIARQALEEVRTAIAGWRSAGLEAEIGNAAALCETAGLRFERPAGELGELPPLAEGALAMALREAVTNVLRHADATICRVRFSRGAEELRLEIEDDGRGFPSAPKAAAPEPGHGMANIADRVARLGGAARWQGAPGGGTLLTLAVPLAGAAAFEALGPARREAA